jgi:hypothetical protein
MTGADLVIDGGYTLPWDLWIICVEKYLKLLLRVFSVVTVTGWTKFWKNLNGSSVDSLQEYKIISIAFSNLIFQLMLWLLFERLCSGSWGNIWQIINSEITPKYEAVIFNLSSCVAQW